MFKSFAVAACMIALAGPASAQTACDGAIAALTNSFTAGDVPTVITAWAAVQASPDCPAATVTGARSQTSAVVARAAQAALATGDIDGAEAIVLQAPGMHWAVQAVRGDIAAARGQRDVAAKLYNAALDTLGDPGLTVQSEQLVPVATRLAQLAQENMMLAGSINTTISRGGKATGVMGMVTRGLVIEKVPEGGATATADPAYVDPEYNVVTAAAALVNTVFLPIRFDFDSDQLDADGVREALRLSEFLKANYVREINIIGHTDDVGNADYNLDLSLRRAESLAAFLVSEGGQTGITVEGRGEFEPPNVVDAGVYSIEEFRTIARRVEVSFDY